MITDGHEYEQAIQREEARRDRLIRVGYPEEFFNHPIENKEEKDATENTGTN